MSSNTTNYMEILHPFSEAAISTLKEMAELNATAGDIFKDKVEDFRFKGYAVAAKTNGSINGVVLLHNYIETALATGNRIGSHLLGEDVELKEIDDDMSEALKEWTNTLIGNATRKTSDLIFDPPDFILNTESMSDYLEGVEAIYSIPIHIENVGRFYFNYLLYHDHDRFIQREEKTPLPKDKKILVVDDSPVIRKMMRRYLHTLGYENILEAENGLEAIIMHAREKPAIIFMDLVMPKARGDEALKRIRNTDKETPIIILSSVSDTNVIEDCKKLGLTGYIIKPLTSSTGPDELKKYLYV